jgi:hypothetical protein
VVREGRHRGDEEQCWDEQCEAAPSNHLRSP